MVTLYGADFSHFDDVPSGARMVLEGFGFMTHKAGGDRDDPELAAWWTALKPQRGKMLLGAYWVLYPGNGAGRADAFLARLDSQCPGWRDGPFILQADCEEWNNDPGTVPTKADIKAFCDRLRVKAPKLVPIVYAPKWVYADKLSGLGYPLWASSYVTGSGYASDLYPGDGSAKWAAYSGQTPAILQFSSSATIAGKTTCDANAYRGTLAQLTNLVAPGWEEDTLSFIDNQADFNAALTAWAKTADGATALGNAVANHVEPNPFLNWDVDPEPDPAKGVNAATRRVGGDIRMVAYRLFNMEKRLDAAINDEQVLTLDPAVLQSAIVGALKQLAADDPTVLKGLTSE